MADILNLMPYVRYPDIPGAMAEARQQDSLLKSEALKRQELIDQKAEDDQTRAQAQGMFAGDPNATARAYGGNPEMAAKINAGAQESAQQVRAAAQKVVQYAVDANGQPAVTPQANAVYHVALARARQLMPTANLPDDLDMDTLTKISGFAGAGGQAKIHSAFQGQDGNVYTLDQFGNPTDTGVGFVRKSRPFNVGGAEYIFDPVTRQVTPAMAGGQQAPQAAPTGFDANIGPLLQREGGYKAADGNGKPVNFGINQGANPDVNVANLTQQQATQIYKTRYWDAIGADNLPPQIQAQAFDTAVNLGPAVAKSLLQQSGGDPQKFLQLREQTYQHIAAADPSKAGNLQGWINRAETVAGQNAPQAPQDGQAPPVAMPAPNAASVAPQGAPAPVQAPASTPVATSGAPPAPKLNLDALTAPTIPGQIVGPSSSDMKKRAQDLVDARAMNIQFTDAEARQYILSGKAPPSMLGMAGGGSEDDPLAGLSAGDAAFVKRMAMGLALPADMGMKTATGMTRADAVGRAALLNPEFSPTWAVQVRQFNNDMAKTGFTSPGGQMLSGQKIADHLQTLIDANDALNKAAGVAKTGSTWVNTPWNWAAAGLTPEAKTALNTFDLAKQIPLDELLKLVKGGQGNEVETMKLMNGLDENAPPATRAKAIKTLAEFAMGAITPLESRRDQVFGSLSPGNSILNAKQQASIAKAYQIAGLPPPDFLPPDQNHSSLRPVDPTSKTKATAAETQALLDKYK